MARIKFTWCTSLALACAAGCAEPPARPVALDADRAGLIATFEPADVPTRVRLLDMDGEQTVLHTVVPPKAHLLPLAYAPEPGHRYVLRNEAGDAATFTAPAEAGVHAYWQIPAGAAPVRDGAVAVPEGATLTVGLVVEHYRGSARSVQVEIDGPHLQVTRTVNLFAGPDRATILIDVDVSGSGEHVLTATLDGAVTARASLVPLPPAQLGEVIELVQATCPTDMIGKAPPWARPDLVALPHPWIAAVGDRLGVPGAALDGVLPVAYHTVRLRNRGDRHVRLLVKGTFGPPGEAAEIPMFEPARWVSAQSGGKAPAALALAPGAAGTVTLPIYLQEPVTPGTYERRITVLAAGSPAVLRTWTRPLGVVAPSSHAAWTVLIGLTVSATGIAILFVRLPGLARQRGMRALTMIALIGSVAAVASVAANGLGSGLNILFGPFNQFIAGFADEFLQAALVVAAVALLPRPGTAALTGATAFAVASLLFQGFGVLAVITTGFKFTVLEGLLWTLGTTRPRDAPRPTAQPWAWWRCAAAFALADAASLYVSFALFRVFYRLYFASWFVALSVLVAGLLYTWIGALAGIRLAHSVRWANR